MPVPTRLSHGHARRGQKTRTYRIWVAMRTRCANRNYFAFKNYGGRGISICERWRDYENFLADMGEAPPDRSIDRINNDVGYEPDNCRWATWTEQRGNQRKRSRAPHCKAGHEYTEKSTRWYVRNGSARRECRICAAARDRARSRRKNAPLVRTSSDAEAA